MTPRPLFSEMSSKVESCRRWRFCPQSVAMVVGTHCVRRAPDGVFWQLKGRTLGCSGEIYLAAQGKDTVVPHWQLGLAHISENRYTVDLLTSRFLLHQ